MFDEEAIEVEVPHELVGVVDQNERVRYPGRGVTSAQATPFGAMDEFLSETLRSWDRESSEVCR